MIFAHIILRVVGWVSLQAIKIVLGLHPAQFASSYYPIFVLKQSLTQFLPIYIYIGSARGHIVIS